jgi:hypothetical protein
MRSDRRDFLRLAGLAGFGLAAGAATPAPGTASAPRGAGRFNMAGYAAPALRTVRIACIGIGNRGSSALQRLPRIEGAEVRVLCDLLPQNAAAGAERLRKLGHPAPQLVSGREDAWKQVCARDDIDLVYITTPWRLHTPIALHAMRHGKHAAVEVPAALTVEECWQLVTTSEETRRHCMMLSNTCYDFFELLTLNLARQGFFGEIIHGEGAYLHTFTMSPQRKERTWRLQENLLRNGNLYPTHGLGPVCQAMNINCGDRLDYLVSVSSNDFMMGETYRRAAMDDPFWQPWADQAGRAHRGNINTSTLRTILGRTILVQHDITSIQPYSRLHKLNGTKAVAQKYPEPPRLSTLHSRWMREDEFKAVETRATPEIVRRIGTLARQVGGHGGMDFLMDWRLIDCLRNGLPLDMNVYDAATWSAVGPLSEWSIAHRSASVDVPDFTSGRWKNNPAGMDIMLTRGGTTRVLTVKPGS